MDDGFEREIALIENTKNLTHQSVARIYSLIKWERIVIFYGARLDEGIEGSAEEAAKKAERVIRVMHWITTKLLELFSGHMHIYGKLHAEYTEKASRNMAFLMALDVLASCEQGDDDDDQ